MTERNRRNSLRAREMISMENTSISARAQRLFAARTGMQVDDVEGPLKKRVAKAIHCSPKKSDLPRELQGGRPKLFFKDSQDPNVTYIVERRNSGDYDVVTACWRLPPNAGGGQRFRF